MFNYINLIYILIVVQGLLIISTKNAVISILLLIGIFLLTSLIFIMLGVEFVGILLIIVYVGAVSILFLFVIMMLNLRLLEVHNIIISYVPIGSFIGFFFLFELLYMIYSDIGIFSITLVTPDDYVIWGSELNNKSNLNLLGEVLFNYYFYFVYIAGLILLLAMLGAIILTVDFNYRITKRQVQDSYIQTRSLHKRISYWQINNKKLKE